MSKVGTFSKILVAIDGSEISLKAAEYGIEFAKKYNAKLIILHVIHIHAAGLMYITESTFNQFIEKNKKESEEWFNTISKKAKEQGVEIKTETLEEIYSVPGAIIKRAEEENIDIIIIGSTGKSGFKKLLLGSVATDVVRYSKCPVFVIK
ncbi:MAG: universal stress protein [Candidatus Nitrosotalea sp.]|nr:universal stress protein [Candidatus Nitrosotalea sp.]